MSTQPIVQESSGARAVLLKAAALVAFLAAGLLALLVVYSHWGHGDQPTIALLLLIGIALATAGALAGVVLARRGLRTGWPLTGVNVAVGLFHVWLFRLL